MTDYVWKHLPYAIYLDTNALRSAGSNLDAPWINELLSITNEYGISVCISELVLAEWLILRFTNYFCFRITK